MILGDIVAAIGHTPMVELRRMAPHPGIRLFANYPALKERVTQDGELSPFVNVYVNDRDVRYRDGLETPVGPDDTVILLPAMAGGAR